MRSDASVNAKRLMKIWQCSSVMPVKVIVVSIELTAVIGPH
jgi:hypothetical protein